MRFSIHLTSSPVCVLRLPMLQSLAHEHYLFVQFPQCRYVECLRKHASLDLSRQSEHLGIPPAPSLVHHSWLLLPVALSCWTSTVMLRRRTMGYSWLLLWIIVCCCQLQANRHQGSMVRLRENQVMAQSNLLPLSFAQPKSSQSRFRSVLINNSRNNDREI